jgi:hypothetical protein
MQDFIEYACIWFGLLGITLQLLSQWLITSKALVLGQIFEIAFGFIWACSLSIVICFKVWVPCAKSYCRAVDRLSNYLMD